MHIQKLWHYTLTDPEGELQQINLGLTNSTLDEVSKIIPNGVYTTVRTYHKNFSLPLDDHIERLEHSASANSDAVKIDRNIFRRNLRAVVKLHQAEESRIRITLVQLKSHDPEIYLAIEDLVPPAKDLYQTGVFALTARMKRTKPEVKDTEFINQTRSLRAKLTDGINEILMVDPRGRILEGLSSNFFAVRESKLITSGEGILPGITRKFIMGIAEKINIPIELSGIYINELDLLSECFITSASRGVLPLVKVDQIMIESGKPGKITQMISKEFHRAVEALIEPI